MNDIPDDWEQRRQQVIDRDGQCRNCGDDGQLEVHYIVPPIVGGTDAISNLAALCHDCYTGCQACRREFALDLDGERGQRLDREDRSVRETVDHAGEELREHRAIRERKRRAGMGKRLWWWLFGMDTTVD